MYERIVITGGGQAAVQAIDTLRRKGFTGQIVLIGDEPWLPYQRPPLSKKYLAGALERDRLLLRPPQFYESHSIETRLGRRVEEISRREDEELVGGLFARQGLSVAAPSPAFRAAFAAAAGQARAMLAEAIVPRAVVERVLKALAEVRAK